MPLQLDAIYILTWITKQSLNQFCSIIALYNDKKNNNTLHKSSKISFFFYVTFWRLTTILVVYKSEKSTKNSLFMFKNFLFVLKTTAENLGHYMVQIAYSRLLLLLDNIESHMKYLYESN